MSASADSGLLQPLDPLGVGFSRAKRADIKTIARERMLKRRVVDLRIVRKRDKRGVVVDPSGGSATSGHSAITFTSGNRSIDANAVRGSTIVTS